MERPADIPNDWIEFEFIVRREQAGWRADIYVVNQIPRLSRTRVQKILNRSAFDGSGRRIKPNRALREGDRVTIFRPPPDEPDVPRYYTELYEDDWILGIDKPAGLPVHPTARFHLNTLTAILRERFGDARPILAHRLDSETSGVLLLAKNKVAERSLKVMFSKRLMKKKYLAIVRGVPSPPSGRVEEPIGPDDRGPIRVKMACRADGMPALTEYRLIQDMGDMSLVECLPRTGRQHQIRVHLTHVGHAVVGDKMYGPDPTLFLDYIADGLNDDIIERAGARRQLLHAASISFTHPQTGMPVTIESPLPADMAARLSGHASP